MNPPFPALRPQPLLLQLVDLTLIQLSNWRWSWRGMVITGMVAPIMTILALGVFARGSGPEVGAYLLTGNLVLALMFDTLGKVSGNFAFMRARGMLHYFASLPIHRHTLILGTVLAFLVLALPSLLVTAVFGVLFLRVPLHPSPWLLLVVPLAAIPLAGLGAVIGVTVHSPEEAGSLSTLVTLVLLGLGPVIVTPDRLPPLILALGRFSPATYAASALRQALLGPVTPQLAVDCSVLAGLSVALFWLVGRRMDWRQAE